MWACNLNWDPMCLASYINGVVEVQTLAYVDTAQKSGPNSHRLLLHPGSNLAGCAALRCAVLLRWILFCYLHMHVQ